MIKNEYKQFRIPNQSICRGDLEETGMTRAKTLEFSDAKMQQIANKMGDYLVNEDWWACLKEARHIVEWYDKKEAKKK